ncbi:hypothetical protein PPN31114_04470 [Pandoraea pneumonica]|uniref:PilX/PilW C-terminal domain-containing protein n=2 Tax=Pandoraea pneumonica TaxID=2508299 RepID=A0A5E4YEG1_9BURK|nr:hypothetical protein PPN31114_04470 [Pandoraea pneumonica]
MVGVFMMMWLAALMTLAASGSHHRQLAVRFVAFTNDRARAFSAAEHALSDARRWLTEGAQAADIAAAREDMAGPYGVLGPENRVDWPLHRMRRWQTMRWGNRDAANVTGDSTGSVPMRALTDATMGARTATTSRGQYFIERIAYSAEAFDGSAGPTKRDPSTRLYRVSAVGYADLPGTNVYLQAIYEIRPMPVPVGVSRNSAPRWMSRRLNWREVVIWHSDAQDD